MRKILLILMMIVKKKSKRRPTQMMVRVLQAALVIMDKPFSAKTYYAIAARLPPQSSYKTTAAKHRYNLGGIYIIFYISIISNNPISSFCILLDKSTLKNIEKYTTAEAHLITENNNWTVTLCHE